MNRPALMPGIQALRRRASSASHEATVLCPALADAARSLRTLCW